MLGLTGICGSRNQTTPRLVRLGSEGWRLKPLRLLTLRVDQNQPFKADFDGSLTFKVESGESSQGKTFELKSL